VLLTHEVRPIEPALQVGEVLNVVGRVRRHGDGQLEVVVRSATDVHRAAALGQPGPSVADAVGTTMLSATLPDVAAVGSGLETAAPDGGPQLLVPVLLATLVGLAALLLGAATVLLWWPRLSRRLLPARLPAPAQPGASDPNGT